MELKIYSPSEDGFVKEITWNHEEIKKEVSEKVQYYKTLVYTDEQIRDAKKDRATLNKFVQALETKRKEIKKQCMAPYEEFEQRMKEIVALVNEPIAVIDGQIKAYEQQKRDEKLENIRELFTAVGFQSFVTLEAIFDRTWLNSSVSLKKIEEAMNEIKIRIGNDVSAINALPEFAFEALEAYKKTLDVSKAIQEGQRLADIQRRKAEYEAKAKAADKKTAAEKPGESAMHITPTDPGAEAQPLRPEMTEKHAGRKWIAFKAFLSVDDAHALSVFFKVRNIEFAPVKMD